MKTKTHQLNHSQVITAASLILLFISINLIPIYSYTKNNLLIDKVKYASAGVNKSSNQEVALIKVRTNLNSDAAKKTETKHPQLYDKDKQYGAIMINGKMMAVQNGYLDTLKSALTMNDGTTATPDGFIIKENGAKIKLMEGDYIDSSGKLTLIRGNIK